MQLASVRAVSHKWPCFKINKLREKRSSAPLRFHARVTSSVPAVVVWLRVSTWARAPRSAVRVLRQGGQETSLAITLCENQKRVIYCS